MTTDNKHGGSNTARRLAGWLKAGLSAYSQIYFARNHISGLLFLAATFIVPEHGIAGAIGVLTANFWAFVLGRPRQHIAEGFYGFNGLLVSLAIGLYFRFNWQFLCLLMLSTLFTVIIAAAMRNISERYLGVPVLSLPFVLATWVALLATRRFGAIEVTIETVLVGHLGQGLLPPVVELFLRSLGAAFFQLSVVSGALVFIGLLVFSRWAAILSIIGFVCGYGVYVGLGGNPSDLFEEFIGFNFILTAIAVGGIWIVLGPYSMIFAALGGALSAVLAAAALSTLSHFGLPVLALPFIAATQLLLFVVIIRPQRGQLEIVRSGFESPEQNLNRTVYQNLRYPDPTVPVVYLPVMGRWTVSQGPSGEFTHQGLWAHAWDFEVKDENGLAYRNSGKALEDYHAFNGVVMCPLEGKVVRVVNHLEDQAVGEVDTVNNWGNLVIICHRDNIYSALAHLKKGSIVVQEGDTVTTGQILGRVGNSGRSLTPHLHFQLQSSMEIGAPTLYGEFIHFLTYKDDSVKYMTHGIPEKDTHLSSMNVDDVVRRSLFFPPGKTWHWNVSWNGRNSEEFWVSEIDSLGARSIREQNGRAKLWFFSDDHYTTVLDYRGPRTKLLGMLYLGAARVPYANDLPMSWSDVPSINPFMPGVNRMVHDLILPFFHIRAVTTESRLKKSGDTVVLRTTLDSGSTFVSTRVLPDTVEITFVAGVGPTQIRAFKNGNVFVSAELLS